MIKLNLGSNKKNIGDDYINVDITPFEGVDLICDLSKTPFEFEIVKFEISNEGEVKNLLDNVNIIFTRDKLGSSFGKNFILPNNCIDKIIMDEVLEHISFRKTIQILSELNRILKPGGELNIQVPDCGKAMMAWCEGKVCDCVPHKPKDNKFEGDINCKICQGKAIMDWERFWFSFTGAGKHEYDFHLAVFTKDSLEKKIKEVGFTNYEFIENPVKLKVKIIK